MTPEAQAAKERKQKIFVLVGGLLLLALLAFQLPKLLGGSSAAEAAATTDATATLTSPIVVPGGSPVVNTTPVTGGQLGTTSGKLASFSTFASKDPFVQQVTAATVGGAATDAAAASEGVKATNVTPSKEFETGSSASAALTIIAVNGARQTLDEGATFPSSDPVFVLVSEQPDAKSVVIGVVGGEYAGGMKTTKLKVGKPLTLVNTATGAQYRLKLVSVGSPDSTETPPAP